MMIKKIISFLCCIMIVFQCVGCRINDNDNSSKDHYETASRKALMAVYNALLDGDSETLKDLLCEELREQDDVDEQIKSFMENTGVGLESGDLKRTHINVLARERDYGEEFGEYTVLYTLCEIENPVCKNGEKYRSFLLGYMYVDKHRPTLEGVYRISLTKNDGTSAYNITHKDFLPKQNSQTEDS